MRELCRVKAKDQDCTDGPHAPKSAAKPSGSSAIAAATTPRMIAEPTDKGPPEAAQKALADHIAAKYRPVARLRDMKSIDVANVLTRSTSTTKATNRPTVKKFEGRLLRLNSFWGGRMLSDISTATCKEYAVSRGASAGYRTADGQEVILHAGGARRDLEDLQAAIGHHAAENLHRKIVNVWLPPKGAPRTRWLTRSEAAALIWAWKRYRETQTCHRGPLKGKKIQTDKRPLRHLARFILIGLYTPGPVRLRRHLLFAASAGRLSTSTPACSSIAWRKASAPPTNDSRRRLCRHSCWRICAAGPGSGWRRTISLNGTASLSSR